MTDFGERASVCEVGIRITCGLPRQPDHGEQLLVWAATQDLTGPVEGIYLLGGTDDAWRLHWARREWFYAARPLRGQS